jgi:hypothetical protein
MMNGVTAGRVVPPGRGKMEDLNEESQRRAPWAWIGNLPHEFWAGVDVGKPGGDHTAVALVSMSPQGCWISKENPMDNEVLDFMKNRDGFECRVLHPGTDVTVIRAATKNPTIMHDFDLPGFTSVGYIEPPKNVLLQVFTREGVFRFGYFNSYKMILWGHTMTQEEAQDRLRLKEFGFVATPGQVLAWRESKPEIKEGDKYVAEVITLGCVTALMAIKGTNVSFYANIGELKTAAKLEPSDEN